MIKPIFPIILSAFVSLTAISVSAKQISVAYPVPGKSALLPREDWQRIIIGNYLDDVFRRDSVNFKGVSDEVKQAVLAQVNSGAWSFDSDDKRVNFSRWRPVDLFIDYHFNEENNAIKVDFFYEGASESEYFKLSDNVHAENGKGVIAACEWIMQKLISACNLPEADASRMKKLFAERKTFFVTFYLSPSVVGHYTSATVDTRLPMAQSAYAASKFNPLMGTRIVDAAYAPVNDSRKIENFTPQKVKDIGINALESLVGKVDPYDEKIILPFVYHYRAELKPVLQRILKKNSPQTLDDLGDDALSIGDDDGMAIDDDLSTEKKASDSEMKAIAAGAKRLLDWCENGYETPPVNASEEDEAAKIITGGGDHPLITRHAILKAAAAKDTAFLESHLNDIFRQNRSLALTKLAEVDPVKAYPHILKAMEDAHTLARFYASIDLAKLAKKEDTAKIRAFLAKEKNRAVKLYLEDALAKAEGRPAPTPQPAAHKFPTDRQLVWFCGGGGALADYAPWEAYYTCSTPCIPGEAGQRAYKNGKIFFSRPTPIGDAGLIIASPAHADTYWTNLEHQLPDDILAWQDGFVYGEESMEMNPRNIWPYIWRIFCSEMKIDPKTVTGDFKKLTPEQQAAYTDWGFRISIEGFNVLYDFTHAYFGKLKPGIQVSTYMCQQCGVGSVYAQDWKFDVGAGYNYGVGTTTYPRSRDRAAYTTIRKLKTMWPDRPVQWLSCGIPRVPELEEQHKKMTAEAKAKGRSVKFPDYKCPKQQEPFFYRWDEPYSHNLAVWQAGGMPGYFSSFASKGKEGGEACVWLDSEGIYEGYKSPSLERGIEFAFADTLNDYRDSMNKKELPSAGADDDDGGLDIDISLEEAGSKDDPAFIKQQADIKAYRIGYYNTLRNVYDTARTLVGMPPHNPGQFPCLLMTTGSGPSSESVAAQWMNGYDCVDNAIYPVKLGTLNGYKFVAVSDAEGKGTRMDEATRVAWIKWLKDNYCVLWVRGTLGNNPRRTFEHPEGDLVTKWPWGEETPSSGGKFTVWKDPAYKGIVVFEKPGKEPVSSLVDEAGKILKDYFAAAKVDMNWPVAPGVISVKAGKFEIYTMSQSGTWEGNVEGVELLTGETNPLVTAKNDDGFAMVVKGDYEAPFVAVHDGVRVLASSRFDKVEKIPGGLKVSTIKSPLGAPSALPRKDVKVSSVNGTYTFTAQ